MNGDEVLVKDKDGKWRVWKDGQWLETTKPGEAPSVTMATPAPTPSPAIPVSAPVIEPVVAPASPSVIEPTVSTDPLDNIVANIVRDVKLPSLSPELRPRLENVIKLRLKDIRDTVDTREVLRKPVEEGGLGISDDLSDELIQTVLSFLPQVHQAGSSGRMTRLATEPSAEPAVIEPAPTPVAPREDISSILYRSQPAPAPAPTPVVSKPPSPSSVVVSPMPAPVASMPSIVQPLRPTTPQPTIAPERPASMVDVRAKPLAVGPIDELRLFSLIDFRRLDSNPKQAAARLKEKVKLLEDESYEKMVEGVRAWRVSPLHSLYVALGQEGLMSNKSIAEVIQARKAAGQNTLTEPEFEAVMELNKSLRF